MLIQHLVNPCCAALKEKYSKLVESRKALRDGVKIQNGLIDKLQEENLTLKKALEEEKVRVENERQEKAKDSASRASLEKEIDALKSEIHTSHQKEGSRSQAEGVNSELLLLRTRHAEMEAEIAKLREFIEEGKVQIEFERVEKSKESANRVLLEKEVDVLKSEIQSFQHKEGLKSKVEDVGELSVLQTRNAEMEMEIDKLRELLKQEKLRVDTERLEKSKESATRVSLEKEIEVLKAEIHSLQQRVGLQSDDELLLLRTRHAGMEAEINKLKKLAEKERKKADSEKKKADAEKKAATKANEALKVEKSRIDVEQILTNAERKKVEENRVQLEKLKSEAEEARSQLLAEALKSEEANKKLELERRKVLDEKRRADVEMGKVEKQKQLVGTYQKKAKDEKHRADHLSQQLEEHKQRIQNLQKRADSETNRSEQLKKLVEVNENKAVEEKHRADQLARQLEAHTEKVEHLQKELSMLTSSRLSFEAPLILPSKNMDSENAELELMKKHLKLKTKQLKHEKEVAKLERDRKDMLQQKLGSITHEFVQFLQRINVLDDCFTHQNEGRDKSNKKNVCNSSGSKLRRELLSKYSDQLHFHPDNVPVNCSASLLPAGGGNSSRCISGKRCFDCCHFG